MEAYLILFVALMVSSTSFCSEALHHKSMSLPIHLNHMDLQGANMQGLLIWRGGETTTTKTEKASSRKKQGHGKKKSPSKIAKKSKGSRTHDKQVQGDSGRDQINEAMRRHKDSASMLGDAIRGRADALIRNGPSVLHTQPFSIWNSLGLALGATDTPCANISSTGWHHSQEIDNDNHGGNDHEDSGGVEASSSAILANYFLQTHGGAHGIQSILSLFSVVCGMGALISPSYIRHTSPTPTQQKDGLNPEDSSILPNLMKLLLIRRTLLLACLKHASGILSAIVISAKQIPEIGLTQTRQAMERLVVDPVAQYFFYCSLMIFWTGLKANGEPTISLLDGSNNKKAWVDSMPWWLQHSNPTTRGGKFPTWTTFCIVGPILIREIVSTVWVISDVLVILSSNHPMAYSVWKLGGSLVDAVMSIWFTPLIWKNSTVVQRQKLLAELVSRVSLFLEVLTGLLIAADSATCFLKLSTAPMITRWSFWRLILRLICAKLYIQFLLVRRQRIVELWTTIRGGAAQLPERVFDTLLDPKKAMGLDADIATLEENSWDRSFQSWIHWLGVILGF